MLTPAMRRSRATALLLLLLSLPTLALSCGEDGPATADSMKEGYYEIHPDRKDRSVLVEGATVNEGDEGKFRKMERPQYGRGADAPTTRAIVRVELAARVEAGNARFVPDRVVLKNGQGRRVLLGTNFDGGYLTYEVGDIEDGTFPVRMSLALQGTANAFARFVARMRPEETQTFTTVSRSGGLVYLKVRLSPLDPMPAPELGDLRLVTPKPPEK